MMKNLLFVGVFLLTRSNGQTNTDNEPGLSITAVLNEYVDLFLPTIDKFMVENGMEPMGLPDMVERLTFRPLLITYHGKLGLTKGSLRNLSSLKRIGDVVLSYGNSLLTAKGNFAVTDLKLNYNYLAQIMGIGPNGGILGSISTVSMFVNILVDLKNNTVQIQEFYMHNIGEITVTLTGNPITDPLSNTIIKVVTILFKNMIFDIVKKNMEKSLQDNIDQINSSKCGAKGFLGDIV